MNLQRCHVTWKQQITLKHFTFSGSILDKFCITNNENNIWPITVPSVGCFTSCTHGHQTWKYLKPPSEYCWLEWLNKLTSKPFLNIENNQQNPDLKLNTFTIRKLRDECQSISFVTNNPKRWRNLNSRLSIVLVYGTEINTLLKLSEWCHTHQHVK